MLKYEKHKKGSKSNGTYSTTETIKVSERGADLPKDKIGLMLYLMDNICSDYERKLACVTKELIEKECQHEEILMEEKQNIISALNAVYTAIDNIKIVEGLIK